MKLMLELLWILIDLSFVTACAVFALWFSWHENWPAATYFAVLFFGRMILEELQKRRAT